MIDRSIRSHVVVCNWTSRAELLLHELRAPVIEEKKPIIVVTETPEEIPQSCAGHFDQVFVVPGDPMDERVLRRANVRYADTAIVLADSRQGSYADMKSILIALAIEAIEPKVYTVVELLHSRNRNYFEHTHVDEIVCTDELTEKLLAQSAITNDVSFIYQHLMTATKDTNELYKIRVPKRFVGHTYRELEARIRADDDLEMILIGVVTKGVKKRSGRSLVNHEGREIVVERLTLNPPAAAKSFPSEVTRDYVFRVEDQIVVVAYHFPRQLESLAVRGGRMKRHVDKGPVAQAKKND